MPRFTRDSDNDAEPKTVNSPLLRSSRIKGKYLPNFSESDTGSISSSQLIRNTGSRTTTMDNIVSEILKGGRTRKSSISLDISESTDIDVLGISKKRTKRSISATVTSSIPTKINTRAASKHLIRAGSETESPVVKSTCRTRASSVNRESLSKQNRSHPGTPIITRKWVFLVMPESPVKEEDKKKNLVPYVRLDTTIVETDQFTNSENSDSSPDKASCSQQSQKINKKRQNKHKNDIEEDITHVEECKTEENLSSSNTATEVSIQDSFSNLSNSKEKDKLEIIKNPSGTEMSLKKSLTKELMIKVENLLNISVEEQEESPSNKENQTLNIINNTLESNKQPITNVISLSTKSLTPMFANKSSNEKESHDKKSLIMIEEEEIDHDNKAITPVIKLKNMIEEYKNSSLSSSSEDEGDFIAIVQECINEIKTASKQDNDLRD